MRVNNSIKNTVRLGLNVSLTKKEEGPTIEPIKSNTKSANMIFHDVREVCEIQNGKTLIKRDWRKESKRHIKNIQGILMAF